MSNKVPSFIYIFALMNTENARAQMRKGVLELCALRVLGRGEAYASGISEALKQADLLVVEGTLYPLLTRMKNSGWLDYRWEESKSGPPRKYYQLTEEGRNLLEALNQEWTGFVDAVNSLKNS
jgi:PadR family transcriptional regulator PadR